MPAKKPAKPNENAKDPVMDVSKPGTAEANASGRPIIITRKPMVQDPMVRGDQAASEVPGPPVLKSKPAQLRKFLTPKPDAGSVVADSEINTSPAADEENVEQKIAEAKVKVDQAGAKTIEEEKPTELKILDGNIDKVEATPQPASSEKTKSKQKQIVEKPSNTGLPAAVKELIEPEDVDISSEPEEVETADSAQENPESKVATTSEKVVTPTAAGGKKPADQQEPVKLKDMNDAPSEETAKALAAATADKEAERKTDEKSETDDKTEESSAEKESENTDDPNKEQKSGGLVDELAKQAANKKTKDKEEKELSAKEQKINKLVEDKTYFLPIGEVTRKRKNRKSLLIFLLLLIVVAGAYAAADAGFINSPVELPYEFIQDQQ